MGCVTRAELPADRSLIEREFRSRRYVAAREVLLPVADVLRYHGWKGAGASGTVQALQEIMMAQGWMNESPSPNSSSLNSALSSADV